MTDVQNPLMTLGAIRACGMGSRILESLLRGLGYADDRYDTEREVSLGDIALTNRAADTLQCVPAMNWSDIAIRRRVIFAAVMPAVRRAAVHTTDERVRYCIAALDRWCGGNDGSDLDRAAWAAWEASQADNKTTEMTNAAWAAAWAAWMVGKAALDAGAGVGVGAAFSAVAWTAGDAERVLQRSDIITAFPPVALAGAATKDRSNDQ